MPNEDVPAKVRRARQRRGKPVTRYKILRIQPLRRQIRRAEGDDSSKEHIKRGLHIVRGHFKDYREKPLFGKHAGIYWWHMHARGDPTVGRIIKEYAIDYPRQEEDELADNDGRWN